MKTFFMWVGLAVIVLILVAIFVRGVNQNTTVTTTSNIKTAATDEEVRQMAIEAANEAIAKEEVEKETITANASEVLAQETSIFTAPQLNAIRSAKAYLDYTFFSRKGLIDQLSSRHGDNYNVNDATIAVDSLNIDWNQQAVGSAKDYLDFQGFSCKGLIDQLSSKHGSKYTVEQATYGVQQAGACS
ncbi:Ltp family lipoprotein [Acinetobacter pittii]|uniref:Ltp family lipoprotein n=1 Tax=Acinetobacter pittii TaxID=48296 RepID=UPI00192CC18E|nr:Ltp family lipoprotein [Acinetobacter pittii]